MTWVLLLLAGPSGPGPFNDEAWIAFSDDSREWRVADGPVREHASVPDIVEVDGRLLVHFVDFSGRPGPGEEQISMVESTDGGESWSDPRRCRIEDKPNAGGAVDPSVVLLDDGRMRMYFFGSEMTQGDPASHAGPHHIYSAVSEDGVDWTCEEGSRYEQERITDPEVIRVGDEWLMFVSEGSQTHLARSDDGLAFERDRDFSLRLGGVPGAVALPDGRVRIFACGREGIMTALWDPRRDDPPREERGGVIERGSYRIVADPAVIPLSGGGYAMIFKRAR